MVGPLHNQAAKHPHPMERSQNLLICKFLQSFLFTCLLLASGSGGHSDRDMEQPEATCSGGESCMIDVLAD